MKKFELIATSTFGLETVVKKEVKDLGFTIISVEDGKVTFESDMAGIVKANLWLRCADRVLLKVGEFKAVTFDELFEKTKALPWGDIIPEDGEFTVNGKSIKSELFSISDCQAIVKKAVVENLKIKYNIDWFEETGASYTIQVAMLKDIATLTIDTSGAGLHKRGYRKNTVEAPIKETLAAALILLSYWNKKRVLYDVFCGSGTIPIEAALIGRNIAPGLYRDFASKHWSIIDESVWQEELLKAHEAIDKETFIQIMASDIDKKSVEIAKENAIVANVSDCIKFTVCDFQKVDYKDDYGVIISNPPYGERLDEIELDQLYRNIGRTFKKLDTWSKYVITSVGGFEALYGKKADRERKLFNGNIKVRYYQYYGPVPPRV